MDSSVLALVIDQRRKSREEEVDLHHRGPTTLAECSGSSDTPSTFDDDDGDRISNKSGSDDLLWPSVLGRRLRGTDTLPLYRWRGGEGNIPITEVEELFGLSSGPSPNRWGGGEMDMVGGTIRNDSSVGMGEEERGSDEEERTRTDVWVEEGTSLSLLVLSFSF